MALEKVCHTAVSIGRYATITEAAKLMKHKHVGCLVVAEGNNGSKIPVGILTDRDIVKEVVATNKSPDKVAVEDVMARNPATVRTTDGIADTIDTMSENGYHRIPVVNEQGYLVGIVAASDLEKLLAHELSYLSRVSENQLKKEAHSQMSAY